MFASSLAWLAAATVALQMGSSSAVIALLVGGVLIYPVGVIFTKALGRPGSHQRGNPLGLLALESTGLLILCLPLAYAVSLYQVQWFFPGMLLVIGGRYLILRTLFGMRIYWVLGAVLALAAYLLAVLGASPAIGAFAGFAIEAGFAAGIYLADNRGGGTTPSY